jgi:hypothetical protein
MSLKSLALGLAMALAIVVPAEAQRGGGGGGGGGAWELLGQEKVGIGHDRDVIRLGHDEGYYRSRAYRQLRFVAQGGEVKMRSIRLVYLNGFSEEYSFDRTLRSGQDIDIDLRGERSYLRQIEMVYKAKFGLSIGPGGVRVDQPVIKVFGQNVRGPGPGPDAGPRPGWVPLGRAEVGFRVDRDVIRINQPEGWYRDKGFDKLHFVARGADVHMMSLRVVYLNGHREDYRVDRLIRQGGDLTVDLPGRRSYLREVEMVYRKRDNFSGRAVIQLFGESARR